MLVFRKMGKSLKDPLEPLSITSVTFDRGAKTAPYTDIPDARSPPPPLLPPGTHCYTGHKRRFSLPGPLSLWTWPASQWAGTLSDSKGQTPFLCSDTVQGIPGTDPKRAQWYWICNCMIHMWPRMKRLVYRLYNLHASHIHFCSIYIKHITYQNYVYSFQRFLNNNIKIINVTLKALEHITVGIHF